MIIPTGGYGVVNTLNGNTIATDGAKPKRATRARAAKPKAAEPEKTPTTRTLRTRKAAAIATARTGA